MLSMIQCLYFLFMCASAVAVLQVRKDDVSRVIRVIQGEYKTRYLNKYYFKIVSVNKIHATALNAKSEC